MVQHHYAQVNGVRLHYVMDGAGQPIVFLHGFPDFWYLWKDQLAHFRQTHCVIAPDLRGYNLSEKPGDIAQYQIPTLVEDIRGLVDHLGHTSITLVGHDWGSAIAWEFAARYPAYISKLVVLSTSPLEIIRQALRDRERRKTWEYMMMVSSPQAEQILRAGDFYLFTLTVFGENANVPPGYFTDADHAAYREAWAQPGAIASGVNYYRAAHLLDYFTEADRQAFLDRWTRPEWSIGGERFFDGLSPIDVFGEAKSPPADNDDAAERTIAVPTLLIVGEKEDFSLNNYSNWFERRVPDGAMVQIAQAGHRVVHEQSALVTEHIHTFIA